MSAVALRAEGLGKKYHIGQLRRKYKTFGEATAEAVLEPFRRLGRIVSGHVAGALELNDTIWALRDVGFTIKHGDVVGIIGRNGAGKSTLFKILSRITEPTEGFADVHGQLASLLEVGTGFHLELTGRENIYLNGSILGMRKAEIDRRFDEIVAFSEVERFLDTPVKHYSSGMQTRLGFAVAAHLEPDILLVDEVLAVGDAAFQKKCLNKMHEASQQGRTVVFISHNMSAVVRLCPRAILLDHGHVVCDGPSPEVVSKYLGSGPGGTAAREWNDLDSAPGGAIARLRAIRVRGEDGEVRQTFDIRRPVRIEIEYEVIEGGRKILPFHHLFTQEGIQLFTAHDLDPKWRRRPRLPGRYCTTATIPGNFLNEGAHTICSGLFTLDPTSVQCYQRDVVTFHIVDSPEDDTARGDWHRPLVGAVRPTLQWTTAVLPDGTEGSDQSASRVPSTTA
jgi:lipopolysaccharide transport system ATP-binding protein